MTTATIEARGVTKRFGQTTALDGLDLVAEAGQVVALLGPNGAGKTTFVRAVATLLRLDAGELIGGRSRRPAQPAAVRQLIGLAGQFAAVEPAMTGRENLEMVARLFGKSRGDAKRAAGAVLEQLGLAEVAGKPVRTYSGGMRRSLDLGASLVGRAPAVAPGRADHRPRPPQPHRAVGRHPGPGRPGHRRPADHPVHGRGRPAGQPNRDHRPRPGGGRRYARPS